MSTPRTIASMPSLVFVLVLVLTVGLQTQSPVQTAENTPIATATPNIELVFVIATDTPTPTPTETETQTPSPTPSVTPSVTPSRTPAPTTPSETRLAPRTVRVPILMYHYVSIPPPDADKYRLDLSVKPDAFQAQVEYVATAGYHPIWLCELADYLLNGTPLTDKPIVFSFDDGYADNYTNAFPVLKAHGYPGTFFVVTGWVQENRWGYMSWVQLEEMAKGGMEIGSHTIKHPDLRAKPKAFQVKEVTESKQAIESRLGVTVTAFSYPAGNFDANTLAALRAAGYLTAVTDSGGMLQSSDRVLELKRIRVRGSYSVSDLAYWLKYFSGNGR